MERYDAFELPTSPAAADLRTIDLAGLKALYAEVSAVVNRVPPMDLTGLKALYAQMSAVINPVPPIDLTGLKALYAQMSAVVDHVRSVDLPEAKDALAVAVASAERLSTRRSGGPWKTVTGARRSRLEQRALNAIFVMSVYVLAVHLIMLAVGRVEPLVDDAIEQLFGDIAPAVLALKPAHWSYRWIGRRYPTKRQPSAAAVKAPCQCTPRARGAADGRRP